MKIGSYLKDKLSDIILFFLTEILVMWVLVFAGAELSLAILVAVLIFLFFVIIICRDLIRKKRFYDELTQNIERLDKAYLVLETIDEPSFYEGRILWDALYDINKSMIENVQAFEIESKSFREYIEMWVHEVKLPLSALSLALHNYERKLQSGEVDAEESAAVIKNYKKELDRINDYVSQVLYYTRSENAENDYHISGVQLGKVVHSTMLDNRNILLDSGISIEVMDITEKEVKTDQKWLAFIMSQLISNAIKYRREDADSYIRIYTEEEGRQVRLFVEDNGIGIPESDLERVFEKSFTGKNGEGRAKSTGMGLYIVHELCEKLGHEIKIESEVGKFTRVCICF